jgi:molybdopterin biosynthesis enzyme
MRGAVRERQTQSATSLSLTAAQTSLGGAPVVPVRMAVADAIGLVTAADIRSPASVPAAPLALRAGWAVAAADTLGATPNAPGVPSLAPRAVRIGEPLPAGADAVLPPPAVRQHDGIVELLAPATPGEGVRRPGSDADPARPLVAAGERLTAARIAALRLAGVAEGLVRQPRLAIVAPAAEAHGDWLSDRAKAAGAACVRGMEMPAAGAADIVVSLGGSLAPDVGVPLRPVAVRPGESIRCGRFVGSDLPLVGVAARLEEVLAAWLLLIRPCLAALAGEATVAAGARFGLTRKIVSAPGVADLVLLRRATAGDGVAWAPLATGDIPWQAIAAAEAWLVVPAESEGHAAGEAVFAEYL